MTTFAQEDSLPRVPLPTLEASCERFLAWCAPLLTADQRAATEAEVAAFLRPGGPGRALQAALEEYDATEGVHSWLDTFWPYRYLGRRDRIALNANFFFLFRDPAPGQPQSQVERAAGLIAGAVDYKRRLDQEAIPPVVQRGVPQSMVQNRFLFSATRIPGAQQDTVRSPYTDAWPGPSGARHIVVFHRGNLFRMEVLGADGVPHSLDDLEAGLRAVQKAGAEPAAAGTSVGHLTTMARAEWATARESLRAHHPRNAAALDDIETALFCVCLEDTAPADVQEACDRLLYGGGGNRWFDKAVSLIVFADGRAGINVEHCELDGTTILSFTDALLSAPAEEHSARSGARSQGSRPWSRSSSSWTTPSGRRCAPPPAPSRSTGRTPPPAPSPSTTSAAPPPRRWAPHRTPSSSSPTSSPISAPRGTWAPPTSRSPPASGGTAGPRRCALSPRRSRRSSPRWRTRRPPRTTAGPRSGPPPASMWRAPRSARPARPRAASVGAGADPAAARRGTRRHGAARPLPECGLADDAGRLPEHQLRPVREHPVLRLRLHQQPLYRRRLRPAARPLPPLPEHPLAVAGPMEAFADRLREAVAELRELLASGRSAD